MSSTVRVSIGMFVGYIAYIAAAFLFGVRPDEVGDWVRLLVKGFLIVLIAVSVVEWMAKRRAATATGTLSESQALPPTISDPPTAG